MVFEETTWATYLESKQLVPVDGHLYIHWALCLSISHSSTKKAVTQFYPANQKQELNGPLTRPPKQEAGDSP